MSAPAGTSSSIVGSIVLVCRPMMWWSGIEQSYFPDGRASCVVTHCMWTRHFGLKSSHTMLHVSTLSSNPGAALQAPFIQPLPVTSHHTSSVQPSPIASSVPAALAITVDGEAIHGLNLLGELRSISSECVFASARDQLLEALNKNGPKVTRNSRLDGALSRSLSRSRTCWRRSKGVPCCLSVRYRPLFAPSRRLRVRSTRHRVL